MDFPEIKKLVQRLGGAVIIDQSGSSFVVLSHEKYFELLGGESDIKLSLNRQISRPVDISRNGFGGGDIAVFKESKEDQEVIERLNQDIAILKEEIRRKELAELENDWN